MKILVARKGEGKTAGCVEYLRRHPRAWMVVHSDLEKQRVRQEYTRNEHLVSRRIVSFDDVIDGRVLHLENVSGLVIDNADLVLAQVFERPVEALAVTWPRETWP